MVGDMEDFDTTVSLPSTDGLVLRSLLFLLASLSQNVLLATDIQNVYMYTYYISGTYYMTYIQSIHEYSYAVTT